MINFRKIFHLFFLILLFSFSYIFTALSFGEYEDSLGNHISFRLSKDKDTSLSDKEHEVFITSFLDNYRKLKPNQIKPHFKSQDDVSQWLNATYEEEWKYFKEAKHPIRVVDIFKNERLIGFSVIEQWQNEKETLHIRQMAILPNEQGFGYGAALINVLQNLQEMPANRIIADTRTLNQKARNFYAKMGFKEGNPHDPELANTSNYLGLEWKRN